MIRYQTKEDRNREIRNAVMGDTNIIIDLLTITESNYDVPAKYAIMHGNYFPAIEGHPEHWETSMIFGDQDGFPNGFQTIDDVRKFVAEEIERIEEKKTLSVISNDFQDENGVDFSRWEKVLKAWTLFQEKLENAIAEGKIIDYGTAKKMKGALEN